MCKSIDLGLIFSLLQPKYHKYRKLFTTAQIIVDCVYSEQDAQLSQRDRAAGCVIVFAKSSRLELGDNNLRTL